MKYNNKKTEYNGILFDSQMEAAYYKELLRQQQEGTVIHIELQPEFLLLPAFKKRGRSIRKTIYRADFFVTYQDRSRVVIDVKGVLTKDFRLKQKLFDYFFPDLELKLMTLYQSRWIESKDKPKRGPAHVVQKKRKKSPGSV